MMAAQNVPAVNGEIRENELMSRHTSWRVGGPAGVFFKPDGLDDLSQFLRSLESNVSVFWFGLGSNILVRDGGLRGVVIATAGIFNVLEKLRGHRVRVGASVACTQLARQCVRWDFGPSEFFAGIPGLLGGALAMNAGAHGGETWERVSSVQTIDRFGEIRRRFPDEYVVGYRNVQGPTDEWFVEAELEFEPDAIASMETLKEMLEQRKDTQPLGLPTCGSVFRNPPGDYAARLIDACGLKSCRIGEAEVSEKHANFIVNRGDASARDIENLILHVQQTVADQTGVELIPEVKIVGEDTI
ncbi:MAG: UDP-N-acetylmuramate dehydrogenase [Woeseia sp.]|nr:UDP-N-acetylmuramate dehydrogenase [Woeseia sp.]